MPKTMQHLCLFKHKFTLLFALCCLLSSSERLQQFAEACSSRAVPKPRTSVSSSSSSSISATATPSSTARPSTTSTTTTARPNITFPTYKCPETYDAWYCLNDATCFSIKIGESVMYNCECATGFMGPRCEFKELDGSLLPKRPRPMLEKASIASGATCALLFMLFICLTLYLRYDQRSKSSLLSEQLHEDELRCRFCNDRRCCGNMPPAYYSLDDKTGKKLSSRNGISLLRQHIETLPMGFAFKRANKY